MLHWTLVFLVIAIVAALLGFAGIAGTAAAIAKILFIIFLVLFIAALLRCRKPWIGPEITLIQYVFEQSLVFGPKSLC